MNSSILSITHIVQPKPAENGLFQFAAITLLSLLLTYAGQHLLLSDELYFNAFTEQMTFEQIKQMIAQTHHLSWLTYIILPVFNLLKFTLIATCISLGYYFAIDRWTFKPFFRVAIQAELVLLLPTVIKMLWFLFIQTDYSLNDLQAFYPLSVLNLIGYKSVSTYLLYPLQLVNLFELFYWLVLTYGVSQVIDIPIPRAFGLVAASYGSGLLVWVAFVMFLTVSIS